ncbi:hypothetical protein IFM89_006027 [Coptis chinensis]|uniref:MADS-box domain-containing protein n=1 Tax=Coptis chinensis TaxID=261450 RepID=A0A835HXR5_9MAGN|nr:hypothetical protein IFM89_006027 [Coptis chinensis]
MVRRKISIERIEDKPRRQVTFYKRRQGIFKKSSTLCSLCKTDIAMLVFSSSGNLYSYSNTLVDDVLKRYHNPSSSNTSQNSLVVFDDLRGVNIEQEVGKSLDNGFWWENIYVSKFDSLDELNKLENGLMDVKQSILCRLEKLSSSSSAEQDNTTVWNMGSEEKSCWATDPSTSNVDNFGVGDSSEQWLSDEEICNLFCDLFSCRDYFVMSV